MTTTTIEILVAIAKFKSFQEAAFFLNYSPAVVSKHVASAEKELGVKLFVRGNKSFSAFCTAECESIIFNLIAMQEQWQSISNTLNIMKKINNKRQLCIGSPYKKWSGGEDDIIVNFIMTHPQIEIEQTHGYSNELLHRLRAGRLDGAFISVHEDGSNLEFVKEFKRNNECEFILVSTNTNMYLAISENDPLAACTSATFDKFKDYEIVFNSDRLSLACSKGMDPFIDLSKHYGFKMKTSFFDTSDSSTYRLATKKKLAIPAPNNFEYPGVKFVKLADWDCYDSTFFVTMKHANSKAIQQFKQAVNVFIQHR